MTVPTSPETTPPARHRHHQSRPLRLVLITVIPACAAVAVWAFCDLVGGTSPDASNVLAQSTIPAPAPALRDGTVQLVGQVVAISPASITTRSTDGTTTTFAITPATTRINTDGGANPVTGESFSVNQTVTVLGVVNNGTPVATALADGNAPAGSGPPMDGV